LSGVKCPEVKPDGSYVEPFGKEARFFAEHLCLNRDIIVIIEGFDRNHFYGTVQIDKKNIGEELLKAGLGQYVDWSGQRSTSELLKAAEKLARDKKSRIWSLPPSELKPANQQQQQPREPREHREHREYREPRENAEPRTPVAAPSVKEFTAIVTEVMNGGTIVVVDEKKKNHKINFASIKVPRLGNAVAEERERKEKELKEKNQKEEQKEKETEKEIAKANKEKDEERRRLATERAHAFEAKEFVRKRLIGQKVKCSYDYTFPRAVRANEETRSFWTVYFGRNNVAVELVTAGLATVMEHKGDSDRSREYDTLLLAEQTAKKEKRGVHSPDQLTFTVVDLTTDATKNLAKTKYFPLFQRSGKLRGVVEFEFSSTRFKVFVPKENCLIAISLATIRGPRKTEEAEMSKQATQWIRERIRQHDIEFDIKELDKTFAFIGNVWITIGGYKINVATMLLEQGFAKIYDLDQEYSAEYSIAEETAKKARKNLWANFDQEVEKEKEKKKRKTH